MSGEVSVVVADDFVSHRSDLIHTLRDERTGETFQLRFEQETPGDLRTGARVHFAGRVHQSEFLIAGCCASATSPSTLDASTAAPGDQRTLVMLTNFKDAAVSCSVDAINNAMFADPAGMSVNALYAASSLGKVSFSGAVVGPYVLNATTSDTCNNSGWADAADAAAAASGVDVAAYPRRVYVMPRNSCPGAGLGTIGSAQSSRAWIFDCGTKGIFAHELGHNLGMDHAANPTQEYGDGTDPLTVASWMLPGVNAPHRQAMGWLDAQDTALLTASGVYQVAPLAVDPAQAGAPRVLMIPKADTNERYYLSYRTPLGFDKYIDSTYHYQLSVHRYRADGVVGKTFLLSGLTDGRSFADPVNGLTVTLVSHNDAGATVRVDFTSSCIPVAPTLGLSPQSQSALPGNTVSYSALITNRDATACPSRVFGLSDVIPSGWTSAIAPTTVTLSAGATSQAVVTLTSPSGTATGTYTATIKADDAETAGASAVATYVVQAPADTVPPSAPSALAAAVDSKRKQISLTWHAATDNRGVSGYRIQRNGVVVGTSATTSWTDVTWSAGATHVYSVVAYDAAGNTSLPSGSVTVTLSGGGRKR